MNVKTFTSYKNVQNDWCTVGKNYKYIKKETNKFKHNYSWNSPLKLKFPSYVVNSGTQLARKSIKYLKNKS